MKKILRPEKSSLRTWLVSNIIFIVISVILVGLIINELRPLGQSSTISDVRENENSSTQKIETKSEEVTIIPSAIPKPTSDPDPIIRCNSTQDACKGMFAMTKTSECVAGKGPVCCEWNKGEWKFIDRGICVERQEYYQYAMKQNFLKQQLLKAIVALKTADSRNISILLPTLPPPPSFYQSDTYKQIQTDMNNIQASSQLTIQERENRLSSLMQSISLNQDRINKSMTENQQKRSQQMYGMCVDIVKTKYDKYHVNTVSNNQTIVEKYNDELSGCNYLLKF